MNQRYCHRYPAVFGNLPDLLQVGEKDTAAVILDDADVEQVAFWFQNRDHLGLKTYWPAGVAYQQFAALDLLDSVKATLAQHRRWSL